MSATGSSADVVVCTWSNAHERAHDLAPELLTLGWRMATALGAGLRWLALGEQEHATRAVAEAHGVSALDRAGGRLARFEADAYVGALASYASKRATALLLVPQTFDARLLAPRLAARLGGGVVMNALNADLHEGSVRVTASAYGGDTRAVYELAGGAPAIVAVLPGAVEAAPVAPAPSDVEEADAALDVNVEERIRVVAPAHAEGPQLEDADIIVAGGRGLGSASNFRLIEELAETIGGMAAASRPIVDDGWAESSRQVGLTGKTVRPALYVAIGVSGASQHMAGCSAAKTIVAINRDRDAAIFRHARYGIVGDCLEIVPELIRALKQR